MVDRDAFRRALPLALTRTDLGALGTRYEGKVRDNYTTADGRRILVTTDRIQQRFNDRVIRRPPLKGQILNRLAAHWFDATRTIAPNHVLEVPDPNVLIATESRPSPCRIRDAPTSPASPPPASGYYSNGARVFTGHPSPTASEEPGPPPPSSRPAPRPRRGGGHDISASRAGILAMGALTPKDFDAAAEIARALFEYGQKTCAERGLILVDTKYEMGKDARGNIVVIDEIHTPDSSRFWFSSTYAERFTQGRRQASTGVRPSLARRPGFQGDDPIPTPSPDDIRVEASARYAEAFERITGAPFTPDLEDPAVRIPQRTSASTPGPDRHPWAPARPPSEPLPAPAANTHSRPRARAGQPL
ncbi:MAG: phosphoribosylaminoimidazolesuccinocarboxamide synthase [Polyangiaceae bacterium]